MSPSRGRPPAPLNPDASKAAWLGADLRARRLARGLTLKALGELIGFSPQHISEVERARAPVSRPFIEACDKALNAGGELLDLLSGVVFERAMQRHNRAAARRSSSASGVDETGAAAEPVALRWEHDHPSVASEDVDPVNRRGLIGAGAGAALGAASMGGAEASGRVDPELVAHWTRLLDLLEAHGAMFGSPAVLAALRRELDVIAEHRRVARGQLRTKLLRVEARWAEFASWLSNDTGDPARRDSWAVRALRLAKEADYPDMRAWVLMWQSQWACDRLDPPRAVAFAQAAGRVPDTTDRLRSLSTRQEAYGHALANDATACQRCLDDARAILDCPDPYRRPDLGEPNVTVPYSMAAEARCWLALRPSTAISMFEDVLGLWPADRPRSRGVAQARLALACAVADEPERAAIEGIKALKAAHDAKRSLGS
ncbi:MAG: helix-turn-helix domain-containing protein [Solirubrobacteraceae bacterium]